MRFNPTFGKMLASLLMLESAQIVCGCAGAGGVTTHKIVGPQIVDVARAHWDSATNLFVQGQYHEAATEFLIAYDLLGTSDLLYNAAVCYEKARAYSASIAYYQRYLTEQPEAADRSAIERRIADLNAF